MDNIALAKESIDTNKLYTILLNDTEELAHIEIAKRFSELYSLLIKKNKEKLTDYNLKKITSLISLLINNPNELVRFYVVSDISNIRQKYYREKIYSHMVKDKSNLVKICIIISCIDNRNILDDYINDEYSIIRYSLLKNPCHKYYYAGLLENDEDEDVYNKANELIMEVMNK